MREIDFNSTVIGKVGKLPAIYLTVKCNRIVSRLLSIKVHWLRLHFLFYSLFTNIFLLEIISKERSVELP
ncbi:hypothetical protein ACVWYN_001679 [Pedobacter sp. UYP24]